jgi:hypothetical protein
VTQDDRRGTARAHVDLHVLVSDAAGRGPARLTSLSRMGALIEGALDLNVGTPVRLFLEAPGQHGPLELRGQVIRAARTGPDACTLGVMFAPCPADTLARIDSIIEASSASK